VAINIVVENFSGAWAGKNTPGVALPVNVADVVRAAVTVGGPAQGTAWHRSLRRAGIAGSVLAGLVGARRHQALAISSLYDELETTEKSGVSYRLGMAFASLSAEHAVEVRMLEHLNRSNALLAQGSQRRADLLGMDQLGNWHVVEAKSRTYGYTREDVHMAKQQALNVVAVQPNGAQLSPATRSACLTDLWPSPIAVLLTDPDDRPESEARYEVDVERFIGTHFSAVPDLLEVQGGPQPPPDPLQGANVDGAYLPGTDIWLGLEASLIGGRRASWVQRLRDRRWDVEEMPTADDERVSFGRDGHVLCLGTTLARTYEWSAEFGSPEE
jgi:hypothetical protein